MISSRLLFRTIHSTPLRLHKNPLVLSYSKPFQNLPPRPGPAPSLPRFSRGLPAKSKIPGVSQIIAVSSAKGGVGKSTTAVNLAVAMSRLGLRVGLLDTDVFGPSIPRMMNLVKAEADVTEAGMLIPLQNYGVKCMSMGFLVDESEAVVWRGLMVMKALEQLMRRVEWGAIDLLVLDMPPGTGDTALTLTQSLIIDGAVVISTPQDVALIDAVKGVAMFRKILGMVQNMSMYTCCKCGEENHIFGRDGVVDAAKRLELDILADVPLHADICRLSDEGKPIVVAEPEGVHAKVYMELAKKIKEKLAN